MSSVEQAFSSNDFSKLSKEDIENWARLQSAEWNKKMNPTGSASAATDALNQRDLIKQAHSSATQPDRPARKRSAPSTTAIRPLKFDDKTAENCLRYSIGPNPFSRVIRPGDNYFIPDAEHLFRALDATDLLMVGTKKFTDAALGWHPLISRYYISLLVYLQIFRCMQTMGVLDPNTSMQIDQLLQRFPLECWPVPGSIKPFIAALTVSNPDFEDLGDVCPYVPPRPSIVPAYAAFADNLNGRLPNPIIIRDQFNAILANLETQADNAARVNAAATWPSFMTNVINTAVTTAAPAHPYDTTPFIDGLPSHVVRDYNGPGLNSGFHLTSSAAQILVDNRYRLRLAFGTRLRANTDFTNYTWMQTLGLSNYNVLDVCLPIMAIYTSHISASVTLADISPVGPMCAQVMCTLETLLPAPEVNDATAVPPVASSTRFMPHDLTFRAESANRQIVPADASDGVITAINLSKLADGDGIDRNEDPLAVINPRYHTNRLGGPFFDAFPTLDNTVPVNPSASFSTIISANYHSQTPLRSNVPSA
jgi:hypothetical protein